MSPRTSVWLLGLALAFGLAVFLLERPDGLQLAAGDERVFADAPTESRSLSAIAFTTREGARVRVERRGGQWWIVEPIEAPANAVRIERLAENLLGLTSSARLTAPQADEVYGLDDEARIVRFEALGRSFGLRRGNPTPVGANTYVARVHSEAIHLVRSRSLRGFNERLVTLRDARVVRLLPESVQRVRVRARDSKPVELVREANGWLVAEPLEAAADAARVEGLLAALSFLRAEAFVDAPDRETAAAFETPAVEYELEIEAGPTVRLAIAASRGGRTRLVEGDRGAIFEVDAARVFEWPVRFEDFRDRALARFDPSEVDFYEAVFRMKDGTAVTVGMQRSPEGWSAMTPEAMAAGVPSRSLSVLADLDADEVLAEGVGRRELEGLGLLPAVATYRIYGGVDDDGQPRELAQLDFGPFDLERGVVVRRAGGATLYRVGPDLARDLPLDYARFQESFRSRE